MRVSVVEAKNKLTQLIQSVESGERVTICRHGHPVAEIVPAAAARVAPKFGTLKGKAFVDPRALEPLTDDQADAFIDGRD